MEACLLILLLLWSPGASPARAGAAADPSSATMGAAGLDQAGAGTRLRLEFESGGERLGVLAGEEGARALLHHPVGPDSRAPRTTAFSLPPEGSHVAPARAWVWPGGERDRLDIEVFAGSLAAFRVVDGRAVPAEVVHLSGPWSGFTPDELRWGLLLWMALLTALLLLVVRRLFRVPVRPAWALLFAAFALVPVLPALSTARLYGPFDLQARPTPWGGPGSAPVFEPVSRYLGDVSNHLVPWQSEARRQLLRGEVPLLNQRTGGGQALLGNGQSAPFSLLSLASLPFDAPTAQALRGYLKVFLALLGTFLVARRFGVRPEFAMLGALGYALSGSMSLWKLHPHTEVMALWPWLFLGVESSIRGDTRIRSLILVGAALTGMLYAGHPETAAMALGAIGVRWIWEWSFGGWRPSRQAFRRFLVAVCAAAGLAAMVLLPLAETIPVSMKISQMTDEGPSYTRRAPGMKLSMLTQLAAPGAFGTWQDGTYRAVGTFGRAAEGVVGTALLALAAAALPWLRWRRPGETILLVFALGGYALSLVVFDLDRLWAALPGISAVAPRYSTYIAGFAVALVGSLGLERLISAEPGARRKWSVGLGTAFGMVLAASPVITGAASQWGDAPRWLARLQVVSWPAVAWAAAGGLLPVLALVLRRRRAVLATVAGVVVAGQLTTAFLGLIPTVPAALGYPEVPLIDTLRKAGPGRLIGTRGVMVPNIAAVYGLDDVRAHDPTTWNRYDRWLQEVLDLERGGQIAQYFQPVPAHRAPLAVLATRHLIVTPGIRVPPPWKDRGSFGRANLWELEGDPRWAFFPEAVVGVESPEKAFSLTRGDRPPDLLAPIEGENRPADRRVQPQGNVVGVERSNDRIQIDVNTLGAAWLVVSQTAVPGWRATVDGARTPIEIAYGVLIAVRVPPGPHAVELRYRPLGWRIGAPVSAITAALLLAALVFARGGRGPRGPLP